MLKVIIAPDSFKGSISATAAAAAIARGIHGVFPNVETVELPIADGGEGTLDVLVDKKNQCSMTVSRTDGKPIEAKFGIVGNTAVIEMSRAAGLCTVPEGQRNPEMSTTRGVGELMLAALDKNCRKIVLTVGGSGSNDGGVGMLEVLGVKFYCGDEQIENIRAGDMERITDIDISEIDKRLYGTEITLACDVKNPLLGKNGATYTYGPQKGVCGEMLYRLEAGMQNYARCIAEAAVDVSNVSGTGAGGGIGFPLVALFGAEIRSGIDSVLRAIDFEKNLENADLVITGEGRIDGQSCDGKAISGVAMKAKAHGIPVIALVGAAADDADKMLEYGVSEIHTLVSIAKDTRDAINNADTLLARLAAQVIKKYK